MRVFSCQDYTININFGAIVSRLDFFIKLKQICAANTNKLVFVVILKVTLHLFIAVISYECLCACACAN
jgi:hypothetical protein